MNTNCCLLKENLKERKCLTHFSKVFMPLPFNKTPEMRLSDSRIVTEETKINYPLKELQE